MNPEIEKLIDIATKGDIVTPRQREIIRNKAISLGEDPDEAELILDLTMKKNDVSLVDSHEEDTMERPGDSPASSEDFPDHFPEETIQPQKLHKKSVGKVLFGVCAGIAERYGLSPLLVRILFFFTYYISIWVYIVLAITLPKDY